MYNSTLEGSQLTLQCAEFPNDTFTAVCLRDGSWSVDFASFACTLSSGIFIPGPMKSRGHENHLLLFHTLLFIAVMGCTHVHDNTDIRLGTNIKGVFNLYQHLLL